MPNGVRIAAIRHRFRKSPAHTELALRLPQQRQTGIGRLVAARAKSKVSFLGRTDGRSKGSGVASIIAAMALG
jgi:hypothetical protein